MSWALSRKTLEKIDTGKLSVDKAYKQLKKQEKALEQEKNSETDFSENFNPFDDMEEISDTLEDSSGNPSPISFIQRKPAEPKMTPEEDNERTRERRESYLLGLSDGFYKALVFACAEISKGRTPEDVYKDDRVSDLSPSFIEKFELPEDAEDIVVRW